MTTTLARIEDVALSRIPTPQEGSQMSTSQPPYPTSAGRPPNICGKCGAQWWDTHVCPMMSSVAPIGAPMLYPKTFPATSVSYVDKGQLDAAEAKVSMLRDALGEFYEFVCSELDHNPSPDVGCYLNWSSDRLEALREVLNG